MAQLSSLNKVAAVTRSSHNVQLIKNIYWLIQFAVACSSFKVCNSFHRHIKISPAEFAQSNSLARGPFSKCNIYESSASFHKFNLCVTSNEKRLMRNYFKARKFHLKSSLKRHNRMDDEVDSQPTERVVGVTLKIAFDESWSVADNSDEKSERFTSPKSLDMVHRLRRARYVLKKF
mmetsp:Transcript_41698/g.48663  ORF Transcript_41698/g.48663 Transcript_41698/m.48663 type:complete len:176 (-) Transcript_41698:1269-1796(-)